ncbi:MAG: hypothetical protein KAJ78_04435, partial [Acidobacteria bacterium]|nr:hypothetical protein [Acidobacteriota bacterium]
AEGSCQLLRTFTGDRESMYWDLAFDPTGTLLVATQESGKIWIWGLHDPPGADPQQIVGGWAGGTGTELAFPPTGRWFARAGGIGGVTLWPIDSRRPFVLRGHTGPVKHLVFSPDGTWLVSAAIDGTLRMWSLKADSHDRGRVLCRMQRPIAETGQMEVSPDGRFVALTTGHGAVKVIPVNGAGMFELRVFQGRVLSVDIGPDGRTVAAGGGMVDPSEAVIRVYDLDGGEIIVLDGGDGQAIRQLRFTTRDNLLAASDGRLWRWNLATRSRELQFEGVNRFDAGPEGKIVVALRGGTSSPGDSGVAVVHDLERDTTVVLEAHGTSLLTAALGPLGKTVVTGGRDRIVRAGPAAGGEPHLLYGHRGMVKVVAVSPDGQWIASGSRDGTIRLWPMPTGRPFHTLPREELLDRLRALRSYRVNRDYSDPRGYSDEPVPFRGWETVPEW